MPPKRNRAKSADSKRETLEEIQVDTIIEEVDPYQELRYYPPAVIPPLWFPPRRKTKMPVLKNKPQALLGPPRGAPFSVPQGTFNNRPLVSNHSMSPGGLLTKRSVTSCVSLGSSRLSTAAMSKKKKAGPLALNDKVMTPKPLQVWRSPGETVGVDSTGVLRRVPCDGSEAYRQRLEESFIKESAILQRHIEAKRMQLNMEHFIMNKTGKDQDSLLVRKNQVLSKLRASGQEKACIKLERTETPNVFPATAFFMEGERLKCEKQGICYTLTRRQRGYNVVTDWLGCPEETDEIRDRLRLNCGLQGILTFEDREGQDMQSPDKHFEPEIAKLAVVGKNYLEIHDALAERYNSWKNLDVGRPPDGVRINLNKFTEDTTRQKSPTPSSSAKTDILIPRSAVSLAFGRTELFYSVDPESEKRRWIIELGCTGTIGSSTISSIMMTNTGTTAIHFNWVKMTPSDKFQLQKHHVRRFVFDCWGGTILPNETFRVPVLYKCTELGFYTEDWRMMTKPVLENGAHIIVRLWGITRQHDPHRRIRKRIDGDLHQKMTLSIARYRVDKIIDYLPLKEVPLKEIRFPLLHLGPDCFRLNNPWLHYHSASVYRLGKLSELIDCRIAQREAFMPTSGSTSVSSMASSDDNLSSPDSQLRSLTSLTRQTEEQEEATEEDEEEEQDIVSMDTVATVDYATFRPTSDLAFNIRALRRIIARQIDPDTLLRKTMAEVKEELKAKTSTVTTNGFASAIRTIQGHLINVANPDVFVDRMRAMILEENESLELQESLFLLLNAQVTSCLFRTDLPVDPWRLNIRHTLLCNVIDTFSDFARSLQVKCCEGELRHQELEREMPASVIPLIQPPTGSLLVDDTTNNSSQADFQSQQSTIDQTGYNILSDDDQPEEEMVTTMEGCLSKHPRIGLRSDRYHHLYYTRLYTRMYELLGDFVSSLADLVEETKELYIDHEEIRFTRIRDIPMNVNVEELLRAPLPPKWVRLAQKMDAIQTANRSRQYYGN